MSHIPRFIEYAAAFERADLVLELEKTARFEGDRIAHLEDRYTPKMQTEAEAYLSKYAEKLGIEAAPR